MIRRLWRHVAFLDLDIPPSDEVIASGKYILSDAVHWKQGATYEHGKVKTFSAKIHAEQPGLKTATWYMRVSEHGPEDGTFDDFWEGLGSEHTLHEKEYIPDIDKVTLIKAADPGVMWNLHYTFHPAIISPRTFTVLLVSHLEAEKPRQGWIVSVPFDSRSDSSLASMEQPGVRGRYAAVERILELEDGRVEWRMATSSTPGGAIPDFLSGPSIPKTISHDVKHFLQWLQKRRQQDTIANDSSPPAQN
ncbi:hypothetical protein FRB99_004574 [Tulasnella sp. 403]|nr:hypothetical protein FRB99_004574 [Tulasnella sp. 403]